MAASFSDLLLSLDAAQPSVALLDFDAQTRLRLPRNQRAYFHLVLIGEPELQLHGDAVRHRLQQGDFALLARGAAHDIGPAAGGSETILLENLPTAEETPRLTFGVGGTNLVLSGCFGLEQSRDMVPDSGMPPLQVERLGSDTFPAILGRPADLASLPTQLAGPGARAIVAVLLRLLYVSTMRRNLLSLTNQDGCGLRIFGLPQIAAARRIMHAEPGRPWTLESLANTVGMSRTMFAQQFRAIVGETPLRYLTELRLELAERLIAAGASVGDAARHVGYMSQSSFARARRRHRQREEPRD